MNRNKVLILVCCLIIQACETKKISLPEAFDAAQLVVVVSDADTATTASLLFFDYDSAEKKWLKVLDTIPVNIGNAGFAWGNGLQQGIENTIRKKEGDGKSPAGIFFLRSAFGYVPPNEFLNARYEYEQMTPSRLCIDDPASGYYNNVMDTTKIQAQHDWRSAEVMRRNDDLYKWGIRVGYNESMIKDAGSCIFFHVWRRKNSPTTGCTSMSEENLLILLKKLDSKLNPVVVQGTQAQYAEMKKHYDLP